MTAPATATLIGVGVGPGDPELVTLKTARLLRDADVVLVPETETSDGQPGRAETIVTHVVPEATIQRVAFYMRDRTGVTTRRKQAWKVAAEAAVAAFDAGAATVVFATIGDPSVYSTFSYLAGEVSQRRPEVAIEVVPGITAMQALAAASRIPLVEGQETLALVPATAGEEQLQQVLQVADTVVAYKGGRHLAHIAELAGDRPGVVGIQLGMDGEQIVPLSEAEAGPYFSTVLIPAGRDRIGGSL